MHPFIHPFISLHHSIIPSVYPSVHPYIHPHIHPLFHSSMVNPNYSNVSTCGYSWKAPMPSWSTSLEPPTTISGLENKVNYGCSVKVQQYYRCYQMKVVHNYHWKFTQKTWKFYALSSVQHPCIEVEDNAIGVRKITFIYLWHCKNIFLPAVFISICHPTKSM